MAWPEVTDELFSDLMPIQQQYFAFGACQPVHSRLSLITIDGSVSDYHSLPPCMRSLLTAQLDAASNVCVNNDYSRALHSMMQVCGVCESISHPKERWLAPER